MGFIPGFQKDFFLSGFSFFMRFPFDSFLSSFSVSFYLWNPPEDKNILLARLLIMI
jgi:hypothetical protein